MPQGVYSILLWILVPSEGLVIGSSGYVAVFVDDEFDEDGEPNYIESSSGSFRGFG